MWKTIIEKYLKIKTIVMHLNNKISTFFLLFLIICGFLLRIYHLGVPSFWLDEAIYFPLIFLLS